MDFENLILSGGANNGFAYLGVLHNLIEKKIIIKNKIKSIFATSVGTIIAVVLALEDEAHFSKDYFIKRPWNRLLNININTIIQGIYKGGLFDKSILAQILEPLLSSNDMKIDIDLQSFNELTGFNIYFVTVRYDNFKIELINHNTHPDWKLIDAIYASCCLPLLFEPFEYEGKNYLDGGLLSNYPVDLAYNNNCDLKKTLGIYSSFHIDSPSLCYENKSKMKLFDFIFNLIWKIWDVTKINQLHKDELAQQIIIDTGCYYDSIYASIESETEREKLYNYGYEIANNLYP